MPNMMIKIKAAFLSVMYSELSGKTASDLTLQKNCPSFLRSTKGDDQRIIAQATQDQGAVD